MQERFSRHLLIAFVLSLTLYVVGYWFIESRRVAESPWVVRFATNSASITQIQISQESMGLGPVSIHFGQTNRTAPPSWQMIEFNTPRPVPFEIPFGECVFQDTTFLPGTVVLKLNDLEIQMLPRALSVGTNELPWDTATIVVPDAEKPHKKP